MKGKRYYYELHIDGRKEVRYLNHAELRLLIHDHLVRSIKKL